MTELTFAKSFLSTLDSRAIKLASDHVSDPKTFEPKGPYTLPRMAQPMTKRPRLSPTPSRSTNPGAAPTLSIALKSLRNPPIDLRLAGQSPSTSIHDLKVAVAEQLGEKATEKIRVLYKKKPCADSKTIAEVVGEEAKGADVEFAVMVIGWTAPPGLEATTAAAAVGADAGVGEAPVAQGVSGEAVVDTDEFWDDLKGWLLQRVRDEAVAEEARACFRQGWQARTAAN